MNIQNKYIGSYLNPINNKKDLKQLNLGIDKSSRKFIDNLFIQIRYYIQKRKIEIEVSVLWRNFPFALSLMTFISTFLYVASIYILNFSIIPNKVPFLYNHSIQGWELVDKTFIGIYLFIFLILEIIFFQLSLKCFSYDKRFINVVWLLNVGLACLFLVGMNQIFRLVIY